MDGLLATADTTGTSAGVASSRGSRNRKGFMHDSLVGQDPLEKPTSPGSADSSAPPPGDQVFFATKRRLIGALDLVVPAQQPLPLGELSGAEPLFNCRIASNSTTPTATERLRLRTPEIPFREGR